MQLIEVMFFFFGVVVVVVVFFLLYWLLFFLKLLIGVFDFVVNRVILWMKFGKISLDTFYDGARLELIFNDRYDH